MAADIRSYFHDVDVMFSGRRPRSWREAATPRTPRNHASERALLCSRDGSDTYVLAAEGELVAIQTVCPKDFGEVRQRANHLITHAFGSTFYPSLYIYPRTSFTHPFPPLIPIDIPDILATTDRQVLRPFDAFKPSFHSRRWGSRLRRFRSNPTFRRLACHYPGGAVPSRVFIDSSISTLDLPVYILSRWGSHVRRGSRSCL